MRKAFATLSQGVERELRHVKFQYSFRSGPNVLDAVDAVFARPQALRGLSADEVKPVHQPLPDAAPGLVEVWPLIKADPKNEIEAWDAPFDELTETSPQVRLAAKIAKHVRHWQTQGMRAGDVLILVRQRGPLFEAIIRALKDAGVAVAGADRLVLTEHIAVMDLMVLADALLLPEDDLALATVLKSPAVRARRRRSVPAGVAAQGLAARGAAHPGRRRAAVRGGECQARPLRRLGAARFAVRVLCARARPGARPPPVLRAARPRGRRCAQRIPRPHDALFCMYFVRWSCSGWNSLSASSASWPRRAKNWRRPCSGPSTRA